MKTKNLFLGMAAMMVTVGFTACSSDEMELQGFTPTGNEINLTSEVSGTRSATELQTNALSTDVKVGAFGISGTDIVTNGNNNQYTVNADKTLSATNNMKWPTDASAKVNIYAYAPYQSSWTYNAANSFTVSTDQSTDAGYLNSDLVYAKAADQAQTTSAIALGFAHKLARISVTINKGDADIDLKDAKIYITNTKPSTTLNPSTGTLGGASGTASDICIGEFTADATSKTFYGIVVPQTITAGTKFVKIAANTKTLLAKLSAATTLDSGKAYTFTATIGTSSTEVELTLGTVSLSGWGDATNIGSATTEEVVSYEIGDYVLTDGSFVKKAAYTTGTIAGIIFSKNVSATDAAAGYNAYAMGLNRKKMAFPVNTNYDTTSDDTKTNTKAYGAQMGTGINDFADAFADYDGLTKTTTMMGSTYYTSLTSDQQTSFMGNLSWHTTTISSSVASSWYLPSFGQLIQILNNLGDAGIASSAVTTIDSSNPVELTGVSTSTIATALQAKVTAAGGSDNVFTNGNIQYVCSTENGSTSNSHWGKVWQVKFSQDGNVSVGKNLSRSNESNYSVIPVVAITLPAEE